MFRPSLLDYRLAGADDVESFARLLTGSPFSYVRSEGAATLDMLGGMRIALATAQRSVVAGIAVRPRLGSAWIMGVAADEGHGSRLSRMLPSLIDCVHPPLRAAGCDALYYLSAAHDFEWLTEVLLECGFAVFERLVSYDRQSMDSEFGGHAGVAISPTDLSDVPALVWLEEQAFGPPWQYGIDQLMEILGAYPVVFTATLGQDTVGYVACVVDGDLGQIVRLTVDQAHAGKGIGRRLLGAAVAALAGLGVRSLYVNTEEDNIAARRLYESAGFLPWPSYHLVLCRSIPPTL